MHRSTRVGVLAGTALLSAALSTTAASATARPSAARAFLADTSPLATASSRFEAVALGWISDPHLTNAAALATARPLVRAVVVLDERLRSGHWPRPARAGIGALERTTAHLVTDLEALGHADLKNTVSWESPLLADQVAVTGAVNETRRALGLKPLPGS